jgi:hypothetical protein
VRTLNITYCSSGSGLCDVLAAESRFTATLDTNKAVALTMHLRTPTENLDGL